MEDSLAKKSDFLKIKYKFFINRLVIYFSFLCIPIWVQETLGMNLLFQSGILLAYMFFMGGQWYLLGKEIDHRFKIYYRANSSMERIVYRIIMGSIAMMFLFNIFSFLPESLISYAFWGFFSILGVFYSWPTRGKIIEETMMSQFGEIRFLDSFEKTILILSCLTFLISLPELPMFQNISALKIYFDPQAEVSGIFWNYLSILYYPFYKLPQLYNLIWSFHFYFIGLGIFILTFYCFLRYFFSRRLSMLGVFAVLSTWSFSRVLGSDYFSSISTTTSLIWLWSIMWSTRSNTYRSGLFTGLACSYITLINALNIVLLPLGLFFCYKYFLKEKTVWYRKQWLKYNLLGGVIALAVLVGRFDQITLSFNHLHTLLSMLADFVYRKAFFAIAPIGFFLSLLYFFNRSGWIFTYASFDRNKMQELIFGISTIIFVGIMFNPTFVSDFSLIWMLAFFSLIPIEWIFQSISRLRSKRNLIYAMYILVCLLDSHLETRFRIIGKMFLEIESLKYFIQL